MIEPVIDKIAAELNRAIKPCTLVLFGASGDLTKRMVMPAIFRLGYYSAMLSGLSG